MPPQDDAAERARRAAAGAPLMGFVEFTTGLVHGVFQTLVDTTMEQMRAYSDLIAAVSGSLADYQNRTIGDIDAATLKYLNETIVPEFVDPGTNPLPVLVAADKNSTTPLLTIRRDKVDSLINLYDGVSITGDTAHPQRLLTDGLQNEEAATGDITISRKDLYAFTSAFLQKGISRSFAELRTLLEMGLMKVIPKEGFIETALTFDVTTTDTAERTSTETDTDVSNRSRNVGVNARLFGSRGITSILGKATVASSLGGSVAGSFNSSNTNTKLHVKVVNEKTTSVTNVHTDITGRVRINFVTDYFPAVPPAQAQPALPPASS